MLSRFDDYPIHQTSRPLFHTASSDRFTYDRYWYNGHSRDGRFYFGVGMGRYPNLGILDCGFSLVIDGYQYAFHGSRRAPLEPTETEVGPFSIEILEPMGRHRVVLAANETGIECDLVFTPRTAVIEEGFQSLGNERHVVMEATRLDQFGHWSGTIKYNGQELLVEAGSTFGLKDRSWGIRPVGERYEGAAPLADYQAVHFMWAPIHWENECTLAGWFEDDQGNQWHADQAIVPAYKEFADIPGVVDPAAQIWSGRVNHDITMGAGTRQMSAATVVMNDDKSGGSIELTLEPRLLYRMKGIGYQHPEWGHGAWKGELAIGGESWAIDDVDPLALENIHIQQVVTARRGDEVGHGVLEQLHIGPWGPAGFEDWFDGA